VIVEDRGSCQLISHPNGIYELIWEDISDMVVDDWLVYMDALYHHTQRDYMLRLMYTIRTSDMPSLNFVARGIKRLGRKYPIRSKSRTAIVVESQYAQLVLQMLTRMLDREEVDQTRFFTPAEANAAVAWLLQNDPAENGSNR